MDGQPLVWFTTFLLAVVVVLLVAVAAFPLPRALRTTVWSSRFFCPGKGRSVTVRFLGDRDRRPVDVIACTAFADPTGVVCARDCLDLAFLLVQVDANIVHGWPLLVRP